VAPVHDDAPQETAEERNEFDKSAHPVDIAEFELIWPGSWLACEDPEQVDEVNRLLHVVDQRSRRPFSRWCASGRR
jgi:hypothetical protein